MKKWLFAFTIVAMLISLCTLPALADMELNDIPDMTAAFEADPSKPHAPSLTGFYKFDVPVSEELTRTAYIYIPADTPIKRGTVMIVPPATADSLSFLEETGWKAAADANQFVLVLMEAEDGAWKADEDAYVKAVLGKLKANSYYQHGGRGAYYIVGYEDGTPAASYEAITNTDQYAGLALLGGEATGVRQPENATGAPLPLPVWIVTGAENAANRSFIEYWIDVNGCSADDAVSSRFADAVYEAPDYLALTNQMTEQLVSKVAVTYGGAEKYNDPAFIENLYCNFLFRVQCFPAYGSNRVLRSWALPEEVGNERVELEVDGLNRHFFVYVPSDVKAGKLENVPLVFVFHGMGGSGEEFSVRSGWTKLAEEKNCIVVHPTGSRNGNYVTAHTWGAADIPFLSAMLEHMKANYSVDSTRVYLTGTSMGSIFSTMCMAQMPEKFAAMASSDFVYDITTFGPVEGLPIAIMTGVGTLDSYLNTEDLLATPSIIALQGYMAQRFGLTAFEDYRTYQNGAWKYYIWENEQGVPLYVLESSIGKVHADMPDETYMFYDYMTKFQRTEDGKLFYLGEEVLG